METQGRDLYISSFTKVTEAFLQYSFFGTKVTKGKVLKVRQIHFRSTLLRNTKS